MSEKITAKVLKKQREKAEKLMSVFGEDYNEWLFQQHEKYIEENSERALNELLNMKEKYSAKSEELEETEELEQSEQLKEKALPQLEQKTPSQPKQDNVSQFK